MSELKFYNPTTSWGRDSQFHGECAKPVVKIIESSNGEFVKRSDAMSLIGQLQQRIAELEDSAIIWKRTSEDLVEYRDKIKKERDELAATVERLRGEINSTVVEAIEQYAEDGGNNYWIMSSERLEALKQADDAATQQNLNAVKRQAFIEGAMTFRAFHSPYQIEKEANKKYPSDKE